MTMSEANGFATIAALESRRGRRRFKEYQWFDIGRLTIQSAMADEWGKIDSARTRARLAAIRGDVKEHEKATQEFTLQTLYLLVLDQERNPFFSPANKELILSVDAALVDALVSECMDHCALEDVSVGDAQKNLPATSSDKPPSESGGS